MKFIIVVKQYRLNLYVFLPMKIIAIIIKL